MFTKTLATTFILCGALSLNANAQSSNSANPQPKVVIGYVGGYRGLVNTATIDAAKLTHINYAFIDIKNNRAWLHNEVTDTVNFRNLNMLKQQNPALKILISIGGWSWSENFSDAVLTDTSRKAFAESAVAIVRDHDLDGVDIDWEYPGLKGEDNIFRPEDKQNYTLMFKEIREELDTLQQQTGKKYLVTTAVGGGSYYTEHTEMDKAVAYLDYVNLMTYDFSGSRTKHHTNLYARRKKDLHESSADHSVQIFLDAGVPAHKLVMGIAFYGRGGGIDSIINRRGYDQKITSPFRAGGYTYIKDSLMIKPGFRTYWDRRAKAPYIFNKTDKKFVSYDNERSVALKCKYVKKHDLAGVMFWEYYSDPKGYLLTAIDEAIK
jgi:chitinase